MPFFILIMCILFMNDFYLILNRIVASPLGSDPSLLFSCLVITETSHLLSLLELKLSSLSSSWSSELYTSCPRFSSCGAENVVSSVEALEFSPELTLVPPTWHLRVTEGSGAVFFFFKFCLLVVLRTQVCHCWVSPAPDKHLLPTCQQVCAFNQMQRY